mgnify:CR=1 FL=1
MREVLYGLRERNLQRVNLVFRDAFREMHEPSEGLRKAFEHLEAHFR